MLDSRENTKVPLGVSCWKSALGVPGWGVPPTGGAKLHSLFWARKLLGAGCPWMGQLKKHLWASQLCRQQLRISLLDGNLHVLMGDPWHVLCM